MTKDEMIVTLQRALDLLKRDRYPDPEINAVITALRGINSKPTWYIVVDADGLPEYVAIDKNSAHDHINDAISIYETEGAGKWRVIPMYAAPPEMLPQPKINADLFLGMAVSIDVSTGEHDAQNRYFGVVNEVMQTEDKNGFALLVTEPVPNFNPQPVIPSGWKLVPVEPTTDMVLLGCDSYLYGVKSVYQAMLDAAPQPAGFTDAQIEAAARALFECDSCVYYQYSEDTEQDWEEAKEAIYRNVKTILEAAVKAGTTA